MSLWNREKKLTVEVERSNTIPIRRRTRIREMSSGQMKEVGPLKDLKQTVHDEVTESDQFSRFPAIERETPQRIYHTTIMSGGRWGRIERLGSWRKPRRVNTLLFEIIFAKQFSDPHNFTQWMRSLYLRSETEITTNNSQPFLATDYLYISTGESSQTKATTKIIGQTLQYGSKLYPQLPVFTSWYMDTSHYSAQHLSHL